MYSITGEGERLNKVLGQTGSKLAQKAPIDLQWENDVSTFSRVVFGPILFILAGNEDMHKISDEFEFQSDWTTDYEVSCP